MQEVVEWSLAWGYFENHCSFCGVQGEHSPCEIRAGSHQTAQFLFAISVLKHENIPMRKQKSPMQGLRASIESGTPANKYTNCVRACGGWESYLYCEGEERGKNLG